MDAYDRIMNNTGHFDTDEDEELIPLTVEDARIMVATHRPVSGRWWQCSRCEDHWPCLCYRSGRAVLKSVGEDRPLGN